MTTNPAEPQKEISLRELYPELRETELQDAERRLDDYLALAFRIWTRIQSDPEALANFETLTASQPHPTIEPKRSDPKQSQIT
jgi:hypothetical protein